jgi:hypothetical protein
MRCKVDTSPALSSGVRKQPRRCGYSRQNQQSKIELEYLGRGQMTRTDTGIEL